MSLYAVVWSLMAILLFVLALSLFVHLGPFLWLLLAGLVVLFALDWWGRRRRR